MKPQISRLPKNEKHRGTGFKVEPRYTRWTGKKLHLRTIALAMDCTKAYDKVWINRFLERMMEEKIPKVMISWFKSFLEDRKAKVKVNEEFSKWTKLKEGLPQGAVCSLVLL